MMHKRLFFSIIASLALLITFCATGCGKKAGYVTEEDIKALSFEMTLDAVVERLGPPAQRGHQVTAFSDPGGGAIIREYPKELEACVWQSNTKTYVLTFANGTLAEIQPYPTDLTKVTVE